MSEPEQPRTRGGQPGNTNGQGRGLYSVGRGWTQQQLAFLKAARDTRTDRAEGVAQVNDLLMGELFRLAQGGDADPVTLRILAEALFKGAALEAKLGANHDQAKANDALANVLADVEALRTTS